MAERESLHTIAAAWGQVVSALVGAVAAFAAYQVGLQSNAQGERQEEQTKTQQALEFFATFNAPNMLEIRRNLSNEDWCTRYGYRSLADYQAEHDGTPYVAKVTQEQFLLAVDFFDTVNACARTGLCNAAFVDQWFGPYAAEYYDDLSKAISDIRGGSGHGDSFGVGIAELAHESDTPLADVVARYRESCTG